MSHDYTLFDEAKIERVLKLRWSAFDKAYSWLQWESSKDMLVEFGLASSDIKNVDYVVARKTVRQTILMSDTPFLFFHVMLDGVSQGQEGQLWSDGHDLSYNLGFQYADDIVSCACLAYTQDRISFEELSAVCDLHLGFVDPSKYLPTAVADKWLNKPMIPMMSMLPDLFKDTSSYGLDTAQTMLLFSFVKAAWKGRWRLYSTAHKPGDRRTIRSVQAANRLFEMATNRRMKLKRPCIYHCLCN